MISTRRTFLALTGMSAGRAAFARFQGPAGNDAVERRAARIIEAFDSQGIHRTGTSVDVASASWLVAELGKCGLTGQLEAFTIDRVDPGTSRVVSGGRSIEGMPAFDGSFTDSRGVSGRVGAAGSAAEIGLIELPPNAEGSADYEQLRRNGKHRAIIVITRGGREGLCPINAGKFREPYGPPILQVGSQHAAWLKGLSEATVIATVTRKRRRVSSVVGTLNGSRPELAPLVLMTPRSGWWHSASERGGGLACWLEALRALTASQPARTVHCLASSGHELGHLGLQQFLRDHPQLVKEAHVWIHFGANIGAVDAPNRLQAQNEELERLAEEALLKEGVPVQTRNPRDTVPLGEAGNIHRLGGRYLSLLCSGNALFHHPADRWPAAVDVSAVARYARAFAGLAVKLAGTVS